jgi:hypothetical protein
MTQALRGLPRPLRAGALVALLGVVVALIMVQWVRQADAARENERLYEQCLSQAQDVAHVKGCTADFYTRWDGQLGTPDATALALESQRLVELRTTAADVTAPAPAADPPAPESGPTSPDPTAPAAEAAAVVVPEGGETGTEEASDDDADHTQRPAPTPQGDGKPSTHPTQSTTATKPSIVRPSTPGTPDPRPATEPDVVPGAKPATKPEKTTKGSTAGTDLTDAVAPVVSAVPAG